MRHSLADGVDRVRARADDERSFYGRISAFCAPRPHARPGTVGGISDSERFQNLDGSPAMGGMESREDGRIPIRVVWRFLPGVEDGSSAVFRVSPELTAEQITLLPPPLACDSHGELDVSLSSLGVVFHERQLESSMRLDDLLQSAKEKMASSEGDDCGTFEVVPLSMLQPHTPPRSRGSTSPSRSPGSYKTPSSEVQSKHMTSVQLVDLLRARGVEPPEGYNTSRSALRQLLAELDAREAVGMVDAGTGIAPLN
mmetsp:Transcript_10597/g.35925  ORF Transcript_10597/g.35925 Transcript_10597/m.35925 type:complete len:255 (-) Transcript_10597:186-950(-)